MAESDPSAPNLLVAAARRSREALAKGALEPLSTEKLVLDLPDGRLALHVLRDSESRERARRSERKGRNPFLPYDERVLVTELSESHVCLLNKFPIFDHHLLIVTRTWESQESLLTVEDFEALATALDQAGGLGFYNAGRIAGASQPHKHLQVVPDGARVADRFPWAERIARAARSGEPVEGLRFAHAVAALDGRLADAAAGERLHAVYDDLRERLALDSEEPYNLLLTREWMFLTPRTAEEFAGIEVNSLGFAGSLFLRRSSQIDEVRRQGLSKVLAAVARAA